MAMVPVGQGDHHVAVASRVGSMWILPYCRNRKRSRQRLLIRKCSGVSASTRQTTQVPTDPVQVLPRPAPFAGAHLVHREGGIPVVATDGSRQAVSHDAFVEAVRPPSLPRLRGSSGHGLGERTDVHWRSVLGQTGCLLRQYVRTLQLTCSAGHRPRRL